MPPSDQAKAANWRAASQEALREIRAAKARISREEAAALLATIRDERAARERSLLGRVRTVFFKGTRASDERALAQRFAEIAGSAPRLDFTYPLVDPKDLPAPPGVPDKGD